jgi:hypothetical protein
MEVIIRDSFGNITKIEKSDGYWESYVYDSQHKHNMISCLNSKGDWRKFTYNESGYKLTHEESNGYWETHTYDENNLELTFKNSNDQCYEITRDECGKALSVNRNFSYIYI